MDTYTSRARGEIVELATQHQTSVRNISAEKEETERRIQQERGREADMLSTLESERAALNELNASVGHLQASLSKVKEQSRAVEEELNGVRREVSTTRNEKIRQGTKLGEMRKRDEAEVGTLEDVLGWRVDGVGRESFYPPKRHPLIARGQAADAVQAA
jgi:kinetochore protein Spc25, fungi type